MTFVLCTFAVWRLCLLVTTDSGPGDILLKLRGRFSPQHWFGKGIRCEMCTSFWFGLMFALVFWYMGQLSLLEMVIWWLALSGAAILVDAVARK